MTLRQAERERRRGVSALSAIYGYAARLRRSWYDGHPSARRRLGCPVVSVGNLVVGGSGKTPVVAALARLLRDAGQRPAVVSRGYARRVVRDGVVVVSDGERVLVPVEESGDEPQMMARTLPGVPVLVCPDRYLAGTLAERRFGATVVLLDDGFQHLQLQRTVDLLVVAASDLHEQVLPSGRLREPLAAARSADAVLVYGAADEATQIAASLGVPATFTVVRRYGALRRLADAAESQVPSLQSPVPRRVVAVAGVARPERFFGALRQQGFDVARELVFRDHHWFSQRDVDRAGAIAAEVQAGCIVTTAKDAVRLGSLAVGGTIAWSVLPMDVAIEPAGAFAAWLQERL